PTGGAAAGGDVVTISGVNFTGVTTVSFGADAALFTFNSDTQISATSPAGTGTVDVTVVTPAGTSPTGAVDQFTYTPPAPQVTSVSPTTGSSAGGDQVVIAGSDFTGVTAVSFGASAALFNFDSDVQITATSPAGTGSVDVTVTTPGGVLATGPADQFTYVNPL